MSVGKLEMRGWPYHHVIILIHIATKTVRTTTSVTPSFMTMNLKKNGNNH